MFIIQTITIRESDMGNQKQTVKFQEMLLVVDSEKGLMKTLSMKIIKLIIKNLLS